MNGLNVLDVKCLNNIPMLIDVIDAATDVLWERLEKCRDKFHEVIEGSLCGKRWKMNDKDECEINWNHVGLYRYIVIILGNKQMFQIICSYDSEYGNHIFFQLEEGDGCKLMTEDFMNSIEISQKFIKEVSADEEYDYVSVELPVTPELSDKHIDECADEFINKTLRPYLELVVSMFDKR